MMPAFFRVCSMLSEDRCGARQERTMMQGPLSSAVAMRLKRCTFFLAWTRYFLPGRVSESTGSCFGKASTVALLKTTAMTPFQRLSRPVHGALFHRASARPPSLTRKSGRCAVRADSFCGQ
ncbi:unnamed protein product [Scytosiphon promiscuus]